MSQKRYKKLILTKNNKIEATAFVEKGRKRSLDEIRQITLCKQKEFTRQHPENYYDEMSRLDVMECLTELNKFNDDSLIKMGKKLKSLERTRHPPFGMITPLLPTMGTCYSWCQHYDPAFYLTSAEYKVNTGKDPINNHSEVEHPQVYIIAR